MTVPQSYVFTPHTARAVLRYNIAYSIAKPQCSVSMAWVGILSQSVYYYMYKVPLTASLLSGTPGTSIALLRPILILERVLPRDTKVPLPVIG